MKKILIFSLAYYPRHVSGAEAAIKEITDRVKDIEFHMVTLRFDASDAREERVGNVQVHRVGGGKMLFPLAAAIKARSLHSALHFDALWAMLTYMLLPVVLAEALGVRVPHILTLQDGDPYKKVFGRLRILPFVPLIDRGFRTARVIQSISNYLATWPALRGSRAPVVLVRNGANPRDLHESVSSVEIEDLRRALGKQQGDIYLVNTARLEHQKAYDDTIRALPLLPRHVKLLIVGGGTEEAALKQLARDTSVAERVLFTGHVDREHVSAYRKVSDIFVGPSRSEGLGNAFLSAMASRLPVVATQEGGLADFITQETAWPVRPDSPAQIAAAVGEIMAHPDVAAQKVARARALVEREYDWDTIAKTMRERVFAQIV